MPLKNTRAFERRIDLASLFCMIGRHGPAVVMAVLGMACLVAVVIIYRTVRERWRRRAAEPDDRDSHAGHRGAALGLWEEEEGLTDTSEDSSSDDHEVDRYLSHRPPKVRHRRAAAAKTHPYKHKDNTVSEKTFVWDLHSNRPMGKYIEEGYQSLESDFTCETKDVTEEVCNTTEPEVINAVSCEEEEKVFEAEECEDVPEEECRQVEHTVSNPVCFSQPPNLIIQEKEINTLEAKNQESNLERLDDIISAPHSENETNEIDNTEPYDKCDNIVTHPSDEKPTEEEPSNLPQEVSNDYGAINIVETLNITDRTDLPLNGQKQPPRLDEEIDQNGLCPQMPLHHGTETSIELEIPLSAAPVDPFNQVFEQFDLKDNSLSSPSLESGISSMTVSPVVEVVSEKISTIAQDETDKMDQEDNDTSANGFTVSSEDILTVQNSELELNKTEAETVDHKKVDEKMDIEPSRIKQDTLTQCEETALPSPAADQGKTVPNENILPLQNAELDLNKTDHQKVDEEIDIEPSMIKQDNMMTTHNIPQDEVNSIIAEVGQSSYVSSSREDCLLLKAPPIEPTDIVTGGETSPADISSISDKVSEEQQVEDKEENRETQHLDVETVYPLTEQETVVMGQKNTIAADSKQLVTEVPITKDINFQQNTIKAEIEEQNATLQHLEEFDVRRLKDSNLVSELLAEDTKKLEEKQEDIEESIVHIKEKISTCSDPVKVEIEDQSQAAIPTEIVDETLLTDTKSDDTNTNIAGSNKTEASDLNVFQVVTTDTFEISALLVSSCPTIGVFDSQSTFQDLAVTAEEIIAQTEVQNSAATCPDLVKVEKEKENLSAIKSEVVEMEPKQHDLDTNNTEIQNGCQVETFEVPSQIENMSSFQTVKDFDNSSTQDMVVTEIIEAQMSAEITTDMSLEPHDLKNEEQSLSEIVDIKDSQGPVDSNNDISTQSDTDNQNGCQKVIDDTFEESPVVSSQSQSESSCQINDSSDMIVSTENTYSILEQKFEYQHDEEVASNSTIPTAEPEISSNQKMQDHAKISNMEFEISSHTAPESNLSLEQPEVKDMVIESEISSISVSPDMEEVSKEISTVFVGCEQTKCDDMVVTSHSAEFKSEEEYLHSLSTHHVVLTNDEVTIVTEPKESSPIDLSPPEDISVSLVANEDSFGSEIEDGYHKTVEELMMQVQDNMKEGCEVKKQTNVNKKDQVCAVNQGEAEKLKAEIEKTEISIMEATMDHNEWITDGNYQVLPWMNAPLGVKNKSKEPEPEISQIVETKPEESSENAKKVQAVQPMPQNVNVTFLVHYLALSPYQTVAVTGDQQELGAWKSVIPLQKAKDGYWSCVVSIPAETHVEWKFVVLDKGEVCRWEECGNHLLYTGYGDDLLVHKWWGFL